VRVTREQAAAKRDKILEAYAPVNVMGRP
jgi:hypothetical protein